MRRRPVIEFLCQAEDEGVIAAPVPAGGAVPPWFRALPPVARSACSATNSGITVKRCVPFLDALSLGWILPLAATVRLEVREGGRTVDAGWELDRPMVSGHGAFQVAGNPFEPRPPMKLHNHWTIRTAPGWSCLFTSPLNRPDPVIEVLSGVVDTDTYRAPVHLPFFATAEDGVHVLRQGTPVAQVIPFRRADLTARGVLRVETAAEAGERQRTYRRTLASDGWYRRARRRRTA